MSEVRNKILICNCNRTMRLDGAQLAAALGLDGALPVANELCRKQVDIFAQALQGGNDLVVACTQEAPLFSELHAEQKATGTIKFVNIREQAGWSHEGAQAGPKIAALLALANAADPEPVPTVSYRSAGQVLIIGSAQAALACADRLTGHLEVSVLITDPASHEELPVERRYLVHSGRNVSVRGYLGAFDVSWQQQNPIDLDVCTRCNACIRVCPENAIDFSYQIDPTKCKGHRLCVTACGPIRAIDFERSDVMRADRFDLILDLSAAPLMQMHDLPQGYLAPGDDPARQAQAAAQLRDLVGEFEKPKFFVYNEKICAHSRSQIVGCTQCIDVCSTRAISSVSAENRVHVEPHLCMGCGGCATVCPSGAMTYAYPRVADLGLRVKTVLQTYRKAGGRTPCILFHNDGDGRELIMRLGRRGRGLPAHVVPIPVQHIASVGLDLTMGTFALGAAQVAILCTGSEAPAYLIALERELGLANTIAGALGYGEDRFAFLETPDVAALEAQLWGLPKQAEMRPAVFNLFNDKRTTLDFVFDHLVQNAPAAKQEIALPAAAPYGQVLVNRDTCTLCMACVGACPERALVDSRTAPQLQFIERLCVQCGLCASTCPENAIALAPRLLFGAQAKAPVVLNEAEPFACVRCGKAFGTKRMIDNMLSRLGTHSMFAAADALRRLQMCGDCRVVDMMTQKSEQISDYPAGTSEVES